MSCTTSKKCVAVGDGNGSLVEIWNGTSWRMVSSQNLGNSGTDYLYGSSCPSPATCEAVGTYGNYRTLAETGPD